MPSIVFWRRIETLARDAPHNTESTLCERHDVRPRQPPKERVMTPSRFHVAPRGVFTSQMSNHESEHIELDVH
jgi:hypothetical protein